MPAFNRERAASSRLHSANLLALAARAIVQLCLEVLRIAPLIAVKRLPAKLESAIRYLGRFMLSYAYMSRMSTPLQPAAARSRCPTNDCQGIPEKLSVALLPKTCI